MTAARVRVALTLRRVLSDGRFAVAVIAVGFALAMTRLPPADQVDAWSRLGVPSLGSFGFFADARVITSAWDCSREGFDVLIENPCDPWNRPMNYPRVWLLPAALGFGQQASFALGFAFGITFVASLLILIGRVNIYEALVYVLALASPAVLLAVERGNNDLCIFALIVAGLWMGPNRTPSGRLAAVGAFLLAAVLKLYPVFALVILALRDRLAAVALVIFLAYAALTAPDLFLISHATPRSLVLAYGVEPAGSALGIPSWSVTVVTVIGMWITLRIALTAHAALWPAPSMIRDAYLVGAITYAGTFFLGSNYVYRLLLLLLTAPQLLAWKRSSHAGVRTAGILGIALELAVLWLSRFTAGPGLGMQAFQMLAVLLVIALAGVALRMAIAAFETRNLVGPPARL